MIDELFVAMQVVGLNIGFIVTMVMIFMIIKFIISKIKLKVKRAGGGK